MSWVDKIQDKEKVEQCVYDVAYKPDGSQLVVAAGSKVLVYSAEDGSLIQALRAHKDQVFCVSYSRDGQRFASGSKDKHVIIWTYKLEGILKYSHNDSIQCLAYNPTCSLLASCAVTDFGLWTPEQKSVQKYKVSSRITSCSWTADGLLLALGLYSGAVSLRNKAGEEKLRIERSGGSPVWCVAFNPSRDDHANVLCIADWNRTLSFYHASGKQAYKDCDLDFEPTCVSYFNKGEYILVCGSARRALIYTREGIRLGQVGELQDSWIWCCRAKPDSNHVLLGCHDGTLACYQMVFSTVHGLYKERYAYRDNMTNVIVQHLLNEQRVRIKCRDMVKKIAIYKSRLAVQLPERIIVYELFSGDNNDMHYRVKEKINKKIQCNLLVVCSHHIVLCQERKLQSLTFQGVLVREWVLESLIRYIKVIGGAAGHEGLLLGLKSGQVLKIFLDNPFPVDLMKIGSAVRCLDLSASRNLLAVVDENNTCIAFDVTTKEMLFQEPNATSVAWNTCYETMLCFSGNGMLSIKVADFPVHKQKLQGFVVGFCGSKVFCLHVYAMATVDIPQSAPMFQYLERGLFSEAYNVACLGVTDSDWESLAHAALDGLDLNIAKKSFIRLKDLKYLELVRNLENLKRADPENKELFSAEVSAYRGQFSEAGRLYSRCNKAAKAVDMFTDLRMFDQAQEYVAMSMSQTGVDDGKDAVFSQQALLKKKADWASSTNEPRTAAEMYVTAGEFTEAIDIAGQHGWAEMLIDIARKLDKADLSNLCLCAEKLKNLKQYSYAAEVYIKMGDLLALAKLRVDANQWEEAFILAEKHQELRQAIYLPYAQDLAEKDRFLEAQEAFLKAGQQELATKTLKQLTENAVHESRFDDASYYYWILSKHSLDLIAGTNLNVNELLHRHSVYSRCADVYYAFHVIQRFIDEPFTSFMPEAIFNIARFLYHETLTESPKGVSKVSILYTLAKQGKNFGAYKVARFAYDKLQRLHVPSRFREVVELGCLTVRSKPFHDAEELLPLCYRCSTTNPVLNNRGNRCVNCCQPFVHSFVSFEILPLVEFFLEDGISDVEAVSLIELESDNSAAAATRSQGDDRRQWSEVQNDEYEVLKLDETKESDFSDQVDPFTTRLLTFEEGGAEFVPIVVNRRALSAMQRTDIIVLKTSEPLSNRYFRNLMPDVSITHCRHCNKLFHTDDYELQLLQQGRCPYCRMVSDRFRDDL